MTKISNPRLTFFLGKGGVGKTTVSTAYAIHAAQGRKRRVALISTDPAHSLADVLDLKLKPGLQSLARAGLRNLSVWQIDAGARFREFLDEYRDAISALVEQGTFLSRNEIDAFLETALPGLAEVSALLTISDLLESRRFDEIVVDTAPIGHTLQLFRIPTQLSRFLEFLELAGKRDQILAQHFGGSVRAGRPAVLDRWEATLKALRSSLSGEASRLVMVSSAEEFSLEEVSRTAAQLEQDSGARVSEIVLNRVVTRAGECARCRNRTKLYEAAVRFLRKRFPKAELRVGEDFGMPILGTDSLRDFGALVFGKGREGSVKKAFNRSVILSPSSGRRISANARAGNAVSRFSNRQSRVEPGHRTRKGSIGGDSSAKTGPQNDRVGDGRKRRGGVHFMRTHWPVTATPLTFTLGKGGVGKTTISGGLAYVRRRAHPREGLMICSTDPAPSLDDLFEQEVGDVPKLVLHDRHFQAVEVDATAEYRAWSRRVKAILSQSLEVQQGGVHVELSFEHEMISALLDIVPPGVDEIFAIFKLTDFIASRNQALVIDMAPTGHALELLRTPERLVVWTRLLLKSLSAHRRLPLAQDLAVEIASISQRARELAAMMKDARQASVFVVMLPEPLPDRQTIRLLDSLSELKLRPEAIFVNRILPNKSAEQCTRCRLARDWQLAILARLQTKKSTYYAVPEFANQIAGKAGLQRLTERLTVLRPVDSSGT
ncbi:MAG TPA: ArsA family ATPase [Terriglobales bacterium]|nr:ArsA family ATPase [Terriglobales bacterium]